MKNQNAKPCVAPPESHREPKFPTLAALGILTVASTFAAGCRTSGVVRTGGSIVPPTEPTVWHEPTGGYIYEPAEPEAQALPCEYRVGSTKGGNTLSGIAKIHYGDASKWPAIWKANKAAIKNPNVIRKGMVITIPKLAPSEEKAPPKEVNLPGKTPPR